MTAVATAPTNGAASQTQAQAHREKSEFEKLLERDVKFKMEYVPFLGTDKITLSPQIVIKYFCKPTKQGFVCSEEQATRFMMLCKFRGLNPWEGDAHLVGYDTKDGPEFNLITAHQAFLKRAEAHGSYEGMESGVTVMFTENDEIKDIDGDFFDPKECVLVAGWARVHRSDRKIPCYRRLPLAAFNKGFGVWSGNAGGMICKCAECDALRSSFPNSLGGMYSEGEMPAGVAQEQTPATPKNGDAPARMSMRSTVKPAADMTPALESPSPAPAAPPPAPAAPATATATSSAAETLLAPTWDELAARGITCIRDDDGIAVQHAADGLTLTPEGDWRDFSGWTVQPGSDEQDLLARQMAAKAITASPGPQDKPEPEAPKAPAPRGTRPRSQ